MAFFNFFKNIRKKLSDIEQDKTTYLTREPKKLTTDEVFRLTLSNVSDAVFITDENGDFTFICPNVNVIFGYDYKEVKAIGNIERILGNKLVDISDLTNTKEISNIEHKIFDKHHKSHIVLVNIKEVNIGRGKMLYTCRDITARKEFETALEQSQKQYRDLANKLESVREDEKKYLANEIHDELGHLLTGLKLDIAFFKNKVNGNDDLSAKLKDMNEIVDNAIKITRDISSELRPSIIDHFGIIAAIEWQLNQFKKRTGIEYTFYKNIENINFDESTKIAIFRIVQETLTNIARHSKADKADISISKENESFIVKIIDNGVGIDESKLNSGISLGLLGMKERALQIGADLTIKKIDTGTEMKLITGIDDDQSYTG